MAGNPKVMLYMEQLQKLEVLVQQKRTLRTDRITISKCLCDDYKKAKQNQRTNFFLLL